MPTCDHGRWLARGSCVVSAGSSASKSGTGSAIRSSNMRPRLARRSPRRSPHGGGVGCSFALLPAFNPQARRVPAPSRAWRRRGRGVRGVGISHDPAARFRRRRTGLQGLALSPWPGGGRSTTSAATAGGPWSWISARPTILPTARISRRRSSPTCPPSRRSRHSSRDCRSAGRGGPAQGDR